MGLELALKLLFHNRGRKGIFTLSVLIRAPKPKTLEETSPKQVFVKGGGGGIEISWPTNLSKLCRMEILGGFSIQSGLLNNTANEKIYEE